MNPYSRFRLISNFLTLSVVAGGLCAVWPLAAGMIAAAAGGVAMAYAGAVAAAATLTVASAMVLGELVFPALFQWSVLRKLVLGRDYVEGTWLQAERGPSGSERLTVMHLRPKGFGYELSGYSLNQENEIESNRMIAWSKLDGPVLTFAYRSLMPDGAGNQAQFSSEVMFEQRRGAPKAVAGYGMVAGGMRRFHVEGVKLTKWSERRRLKKLEQRGEVVAKYWNLFFGVAVADEAMDEPVVVQRPAAAMAAAPFVERRDPESMAEPGAVIPRRRASDWRQEDATPTADRIRARMVAGADEAETYEDAEDEEVAEEEDDVLMAEDAAEYDADETYEDSEDYEAEEEEDFEAEEDEEYEAEEDEEYDAEADDEDYADEEDETEADAEDAFEAEAEDDDKARDEEPVVIRQRYARRR